MEIEKEASYPNKCSIYFFTINNHGFSTPVNAFQLIFNNSIVEKKTF